MSYQPPTWQQARTGRVPARDGRWLKWAALTWFVASWCVAAYNDNDLWSGLCAAVALAWTVFVTCRWVYRGGLLRIVSWTGRSSRKALREVRSAWAQDSL